LADYHSDENSQGVHVALNPMLAGAILGESRHVRISMAEIRTLRSEASRLLHQRLCAWINPGSARKVELTTLCGYIFVTEASASTTRKRLSRTREAISELDGIGWKVTEYSKGRYEIQRPTVNSHKLPR